MHFLKVPCDTKVFISTRVQMNGSTKHSNWQNCRVCWSMRKSRETLRDLNVHPTYLARQTNCFSPELNLSPPPAVME